MTDSFFQQPDKPIVGTLARWSPKRNNEMELRVGLTFEVPLTDELIAKAPASIQSAATACQNVEGGLVEATIASEFDQTIEIYATPDHTSPQIAFSSVKLTNISVFRDTPAEGPSDKVFLKFSTTVKAEMPFGGQLVTWALENLRTTIFFRCFDVQGVLPMTVDKAA